MVRPFSQPHAHTQTLPDTHSAHACIMMHRALTPSAPKHKRCYGRIIASLHNARRISPARLAASANVRVQTRTHTRPVQARQWHWSRPSTEARAGSSDAFVGMTKLVTRTTLFHTRCVMRSTSRPSATTRPPQNMVMQITAPDSGRVPIRPIKDVFRELGYELWTQDLQIPDVGTVCTARIRRGPDVTCTAHTAVSAFNASPLKQRLKGVEVSVLTGQAEAAVWEHSAAARANYARPATFVKFVCDEDTNLYRQYRIHYKNMLRALGYTRVFLVPSPTANTLYVKLDKADIEDAEALVLSYQESSTAVPGVRLELVSGEEAKEAQRLKDEGRPARKPHTHSGSQDHSVASHTKVFMERVRTEGVDKVTTGKWMRESAELLKNNRWQMLWRLLEFMQEQHVPPRVSKPVYSHLASLLFEGDYVTAKKAYDVERIYQLMDAAGVEPDVDDLNRWLKALYATKQTSKMQAVFSRLPVEQRDAYSWAIMLRSWGQEGHVEQIMQAYHGSLRQAQMYFLSNRVLEALALAGAAPQMKEVWQDIDKDDLFSYKGLGIMIQGLTRAGDAKGVEGLVDRIIEAGVVSPQLMTNILTAYTRRPLQLLKLLYTMSSSEQFPEELVSKEVARADRMQDVYGSNDNDNHNDDDEDDDRGTAGADSLLPVVQHYLKSLGTALEHHKALEAPAARMLAISESGDAAKSHSRRHRPPPLRQQQQQQQQPDDEDIFTDKDNLSDMVYNSMGEFPVLPNRIHFHVLLKAFSAAGHWGTVEVISDFLESSSDPNIRADDTTYDRLAQCYTKMPDLNHALTFMENMLSSGITPSFVTVAAAAARGMSQNNMDALLRLYQMCAGTTRLSRVQKDIKTFMDGEKRGYSRLMEIQEKYEDSEFGFGAEA